LCCWRRLWHWSLCDDVMAFVLQCCCTDSCPVSFPLLTTTEEYRGRTLCDPRCQMVLTAPGPLQSAGMYVCISICVRMCMPSLPSFFVLFLCCGVFATFYDSEWCGCLAYGVKLQWFILRLLLLGGICGLFFSCTIPSATDACLLPPPQQGRIISEDWVVVITGRGD